MALIMKEAAKPEATVINLNLTVRELRKIAEHEAGGPCFRMWVTDGEYLACYREAPDWTYHKLKDGRWAMFRRMSDLNRAKEDPALYNFIRGRTITNDEA